MKKTSIDPAIFDWSGKDSTALIASQCNNCNTVLFPQQESCTACSCADVRRIELEREGTLWSWTSQNYPPNSPPYKISAEDFEPFNLGYVELAGQIRVQSKILTKQSKLAIGMPLELTFEQLFTNDANQIVMMYAFKPKT